VWQEVAAMEIRGRGVLVTGASRGLGAALGRAMARAGARVVLVSRSAVDLGGLAEIRRAGGEAHWLAADIAAKDDIYRIAGAAAALVGPLDVVIHNASTLGPTPLRPLLDTGCEDLVRVLEVNVVGPFRLTKAIAGGMALRGRGLVVNVTSDASISAYAGWGAYSVSKAALDHLGRVWAAELAASGVQFLTIDPGEMDTAMHAAAMPEADRTTLADPAAVADRILDIVRHAEQLPTGTRLEAASWKAAEMALGQAS
jgi:NAD(P)-dependent dehydrogenase (short-subunit alcohol dehydrogenase family)